MTPRAFEASASFQPVPEAAKSLGRRAAVAAFCGTLHCSLAGGVNVAMGPVGRQAEVTMQVCVW